MPVQNCVHLLQVSGFKQKNITIYKHQWHIAVLFQLSDKSHPVTFATDVIGLIVVSSGILQMFGCVEIHLHPGRLTWNLQITHLERKLIFQTSMRKCSILIFRGVTSLFPGPSDSRGCVCGISMRLKLEIRSRTTSVFISKCQATKGWRALYYVISWWNTPLHSQTKLLASWNIT